jgi:hypothetical protein
MSKPKVGVNLEGMMQLLNRRVQLSGEQVNRSHAEGRQRRKWIGLLFPFGLHNGLVASSHLHQEPTVVQMGIRTVGTQFNGSFELTFRCGPIQSYHWETIAMER